jgi:hypothetical protein
VDTKAGISCLRTFGTLPSAPSYCSADFEPFLQTTHEHCTPEPAQALVDIAERMAQTLEIGLTRRDQQLRKP